ncbi:MAG: phosphatase PAP2 family protein [Candidatus Aminicenantes bacterium]|nr:phosphatase PAP2 family protein [Candidatus Aminicenantes bacterium]
MNEKKRKVFPRFLAVFICLLWFVPFMSAGEEQNKQKNDYRIGKLFFTNLAVHTWDVFTSPVQWKGKDFLIFSSVLGAGALSFWADEDIRDWVIERKTSRADDCFNVLTYLGDGRLLFGLIATLYASGEIADDRSLRKTAIMSLESFLASSAIVWTLKAAAGRARPYTGESEQAFHPFTFSNRYFSFPSGHSSGVFAVATTIALQSESVVIDILSYSLAFAAASARIYKDAHWFSDVLIGSAIGYFTARKIHSLHQKEKPEMLDLGFFFLPDKKGITVSFSF